MSWLRQAKAIDWAEVESIMEGYCDWSRRGEFGMECEMDSYGLANALYQHGIEAIDQHGYYVLGPGEAPLLGEERKASSHSWLEIGGKILDVTHGQFGDPEWLITDAPDPRYISAEEAERRELV